MSRCDFTLNMAGESFIFLSFPFPFPFQFSSHLRHFEGSHTSLEKERKGKRTTKTRVKKCTRAVIVIIECPLLTV